MIHTIRTMNVDGLSRKSNSRYSCVRNNNDAALTSLVIEAQVGKMSQMQEKDGHDIRACDQNKGHAKL